MTYPYRYPGTKSFSAEEQSIFFGRDEDIANLRTSVIVNATTVLFGKSGTGKSSIIQAGLVPLLKKGDDEEEIKQEEEKKENAEGKDEGRNEPFLVINILPKPYDDKKNLLAEVRAIIGSHLKTNQDLFQLPAEQSGQLPLWYLLKQVQAECRTRDTRQLILLIFDQAEELFTYPDSHISELIQELAPVIGQYIPEKFKRIITGQKTSILPDTFKLLYAHLPVKFLFSIRSDKLHLITRLKIASPLILQNSYELLPLKRAEAFEAMDKPSQLPGNFASERFIIPDNTKESIFRQLSSEVDKQDYNFEEARIEPFSLQIICSHIEQKIVPLDDDKIIEDFELADIQGIINGYYHDCINSLPVSEAEKTVVRNFIEFRLISNNRRIPIHEDLITGDDKYPVSREILQMLVAEKILKADINISGGLMYEITHDCFIKPILEAKAKRLEKTLDDKSLETINELIKKIQDKESVSAYKDTQERSGGMGQGPDDKKFGGTNTSSMGVAASSMGVATIEDFELYDLYKKLGDAYIVIRDFPNAIEWYGKAIAAPDQYNKSFLIEAYRARSNAFYTQRNYDSSSMDLKMILKLNNDDHTALNYLIDNYDKQDKLEEAIAYIEKESKITRDNAGIYTEIGVKYYVKKDYEAAKKYYLKTLEINQEDENAYRNLGLVEEIQGDNGKALDYYNKALAFSTKPAALYNDIGNLYYSQKDYPKASGFYQKALETDPSFYYSWNNMGCIHEALQEPEAALENFQKAISINSNYEDAYRGIARIYYNKEDFLQARKYYAQIGQISQQNDLFYSVMGILEEKCNNEEGALENYKEAIRLNPADEMSLARLLEIYFERSEYQQAGDYCLQLIALRSEEEKFYHNKLGRILDSTGKLPEALAEFQKAIQLDPSNGLFHLNAGMIFQALNKTEEAGAAYRKAIELDPKDATAHNNLGALLYDRNQDIEAIKEYKQAISIDPVYITSYSNLGLAYSRQRLFEEAIANYTRAIELDPKEPSYHNDLGSILTKMERWEEALLEYTKATELDPGNAIAFENLGYIYRFLDNGEKTISSFRRAIELNPKAETAYIGLGGFYFRTLKYDQAITQFKMALQINEKNGVAMASLGACYREKGEKALYDIQLRMVHELKEEDFGTLYDRACAEALCGNVEKALHFLELSLAKKEETRAYASRDSDFYLLRERTEFKTLVGS
ncbi:tetratricopeptide repeat protein [Flavitalea flava]